MFDQAEPQADLLLGLWMLTWQGTTSRNTASLVAPLLPVCLGCVGTSSSKVCGRLLLFLTRMPVLHSMCDQGRAVWGQAPLR
jgi:hypothetical protein